MYLKKYVRVFNIISMFALIVALLLAKFVMYEDKFLEFLSFIPIYGWAPFLVLCAMSILTLFFAPRLLARVSLQSGAVAIPWAILLMGRIEWYFLLPMIVMTLVFVMGEYVLSQDIKPIH